MLQGEVASDCYFTMLLELLANQPHQRNPLDTSDETAALVFVCVWQHLPWEGGRDREEGVTPHADALRTETVMYTNLGRVYRASLKDSFSVARIRTSSSVHKYTQAYCLSVAYELRQQGWAEK